MLKQLIWPLLLAAFVAGAALSANPAIFKTHKGMKGQGDASVNCAYCHTKAKIDKTKGQDKAALMKRPACSMKGCHCE